MATDEQLEQIQDQAAKRAGVTAEPAQLTPSLPNRSDPEADRERDARQLEYAHAERASRAREWTAAFPPKYRLWSLADYSEPRQQKAKAFIDGATWAMFLHGAVGCAKTSYAVAVGKAWIEQKDERAALVPAYEAARRLRHLNSLSETIKEWAGVSLLILDDIGANRSTPHVVEQLLFILQARYDWERATIVTSNLALPQFGEQIDLAGRGASRLSEGYVLHMEGDDLRVRCAQSAEGGP